MKMPRWMIYLWTFPTTAPGLLLAAAALISGGGGQVVDGVLEIHGGFAEFYLRKVVGLVMKGGASAMTLGHVVIGRTPELLDATRTHERVHVRQAERWGPFFLPAYLLASFAAWMRSGKAYEDNRFEREAFGRREM
jgi:hypothetical protein